MKISSIVYSLLILMMLLSSCVTTNDNDDDDDDLSGIDLREYQHGIDFVPLPNGNYYLIFSSSGLPPTGADTSGNWTHDVYYTLVDPGNIDLDPTVIISRDEAQEPASSAINTEGRIMITMEDGWNTTNEVCQRYGIYDLSMDPVNAYPQMSYDGGHSAHVAACGSRFVIFISDEWVDGGGVDDLGSGDDVFARIYDGSGTFERQVDIAVGTTSRDWWPLIAGSPNNACLVWQRFVDDAEYADLMLCVINAADGSLVKTPITLEKNVKYYTYSVAYIADLDRFLVVGTYYYGGGFAYLFDAQGNTIAFNTDIPEVIRESQSIIGSINGSTVPVVQPVSPSGLLLLQVSASAINATGVITDSYAWGYTGTDGIFISDTVVYLVSLSHKGLVEKFFNISTEN